MRRVGLLIFDFSNDDWTKIENLDKNNYIIMDHSKIFIDISSFKNINNKFVNQELINEKKIQKEK